MMLSRLTDAAVLIWRALRIALTPARRRRAQADRHLLIVSYDFPPGTVTGGQLPAFLARHASRSGWRVTVLCGPQPPNPSQRGLAAIALIPPAVRLVRAGGTGDNETYRPQLPYRLTPRIDGGFAQGVMLAYAGVCGLRDDPPTHVFATGPTFNNFLVARRLAILFKAPLTLQYRDEWTVMRPSFVVESERGPDDELRCLAQADLVTFVTEGKARAYREAFPLLEQKRILVASNGWDPDILRGAKDGTQHLAHLAGKFVIAFTGRVTAEIPIEPFLHDLAVVLNRNPRLKALVVICLFGDQTEATRRQLAEFRQLHTDNIEERGGVSQTMVVELLREAGAGLLLNNTRYAGVVPLKTFDYMAADSAILAYGSTGEAGRIVVGTGAGIMVDVGDTIALEAALERLRESPSSTWRTPERSTWLEENNRERLTNQLLEAIAALQAPRP